MLLLLLSEEGEPVLDQTHRDANGPDRLTRFVLGKNLIELIEEGATDLHAAM